MDENITNSYLQYKSNYGKWSSMVGSGMGGAAGLSGIGVLEGSGDGPSLSQSRSAKQPYVGMVHQQTSEASIFSLEDFPALPEIRRTRRTQSSSDKGGVSTTFSRAPGAERAQAAKRGIQTSPDGKITNIPASMLKDQFGMAGLLTSIRTAETDPQLGHLALGLDLTALGPNLNLRDYPYPTFGGPWAEVRSELQHEEVRVPREYFIKAAIQDKLAPVQLNRYEDDLLFYIFYINIGDPLQLEAASELYKRNWRYHVEEKLWITRTPGMQLLEHTQSYEKGVYITFDPIKWRKISKECHIEYSKLAKRPYYTARNPYHYQYPTQGPQQHGPYKQ